MTGVYKFGITIFLEGALWSPENSLAGPSLRTTASEVGNDKDVKISFLIS